MTAQIDETIKNLKAWDRIHITLTFEDGTQLTTSKRCFPSFTPLEPLANGYLYVQLLGNHFVLRYEGGRIGEHITAIENIGPGNKETQKVTQGIIDHFYSNRED